MIAAIGYGLAFALTVIAAAHFYWAFGGVWPANKEAELVDMVLGRTNAQSMPARPVTIAVALAIEAAALAAALLTLPFGGLFGAIVTLVGAALALVFFTRFVLGYSPFWRRRFGREPFARLDALVYSPLCFAIAAGFAFLVSERF